MTDYDYYKIQFYKAVQDDRAGYAAWLARQCEQIAIEERSFNEAKEWARQAAYYENGGEG